MRPSFASRRASTGLRIRTEHSVLPGIHAGAQRPPAHCRLGNHAGLQNAGVARGPGTRDRGQLAVPDQLVEQRPAGAVDADDEDALRARRGGHPTLALGGRSTQWLSAGCRKPRRSVPARFWIFHATAPPGVQRASSLGPYSASVRSSAPAGGSPQPASIGSSAARTKSAARSRPVIGPRYRMRGSTPRTPRAAPGHVQ